MKSRKLLLPALILAAAVLVITLYSIIVGIALKPETQQVDFPFSITYELDGETKTIQGIYKVSYTGNGGYTDPTERQYQGQIESTPKDEDTSYVIRKTDSGTIILYTQFYPDYLMGDAHYEYFTWEPFEPTMMYYSVDGDSSDDPQVLLDQGARILSWEYPEPLQNRFVFSHITHISGDDVMPLAAIAALALLVTLIFVKKDPDLPKRRLDIFSVIFNFVIALTAVPFFTILGIFSDLNGSTGELLHQLFYRLSAVTILALAVSVALRRKGCHKAGFFIQFLGPACYAILFFFVELASRI